MALQPATIKLTTARASETAELGQLLAACVQPGDVVLLAGGLGAGKTQLVQGVAGGLGIRDVPTSPTFNIVFTYVDGRLPLYHFDLYRLDTACQLEDIGLTEYLEGEGVCFIEWAEKFPEAFDEYLSIDITRCEDGSRTLEFSACGRRGHALLAVFSTAVAQAAAGGVQAAAGGVQSAAESSPAATSRGHVEQLVGSAAPSTPSEGGARHAKEAFAGSSDGIPGAASCAPVSAEEGAQAAHMRDEQRYVLVFDTANEVVSLGIGAIDVHAKTITPVASKQIAAHRQSNTTLLPAIDELMRGCGIARKQLICVAVGRGPGSFTGVRIAVATAKGIALSRGLALVGLSTLDAIAWEAQLAGVRGELLVVADAMRKEVYPACFTLDEAGIARRSADYVIDACAFASSLKGSPGARHARSITGDALVKYLDLFEDKGHVLSDKLWECTGRGLLKAFECLLRAEGANLLDPLVHPASDVLPLYTRLSDAEEHERARVRTHTPRNLRVGVQDLAPSSETARVTMHEAARMATKNEAASAPLRASLRACAWGAAVNLRPLEACDCAQAAVLEVACMGNDAWSAEMFESDLGQRFRVWWGAFSQGELVGYAGGLVADGTLEILKVAVAPDWRRQGIARTLLEHVGEDARNLGAESTLLEVRASNTHAQSFYRALGFEQVAHRTHYYRDGEDAHIMAGPLPSLGHDVAGMKLLHHEDACAPLLAHPYILAIESSCDETAAALIDGNGHLRSDVVASQIDFHARFGGVVPEIASRKHIEAICGVCDEALEGGVSWADLDAVAATYAPGLLGGLVVGVAFAKGVAWALDIPYIEVNHLEGHLYANRLASADFSPPAVVSLVSGGNTLLVYMRDWGSYVTLGATIDDAVGEAFDKVAKALGLGYPGGAIISQLAAEGNPQAISFPRAMLHSHDLNFSLSGLKTAVVTYIQGEQRAKRTLNLPDIAASFQQAVIDVQVAKARAALEQTGARVFCVGGGVAANPALRAAYAEMCAKMGVQLVMAPLASCGDNAGMIALVALERFSQGKFSSLDADAQAHASLDEPY